MINGILPILRLEPLWHPLDGIAPRGDLERRLQEYSEKGSIETREGDFDWNEGGV